MSALSHWILFLSPSLIFFIISWYSTKFLIFNEGGYLFPQNSAHLQRPGSSAWSRKSSRFHYKPKPFCNGPFTVTCAIIPGGSFWALKRMKLSFGLFRSLNGSHKLVAQSIKAKSMIKNNGFTLMHFLFPEAAAW